MYTQPIDFISPPLSCLLYPLYSLLPSYTFYSPSCAYAPFFVDLIVLITLLSLNGNVAQSVERKSHNLKVVSSILTVPTFFCFFYLSSLSSLLLSPLYFPFIPFSSPTFLSLFFSLFSLNFLLIFTSPLLLSFLSLFLICVQGHMAQWKRIRLRI